MTLHNQQRVNLTIQDNDDKTVRARNNQILQNHLNNQLSNIPISHRENYPLTSHTAATMNSGGGDDWFPLVESFGDLDPKWVKYVDAWDAPYVEGIKEHKWSCITIDVTFSCFQQTANWNLDFGMRLWTEAGVEFIMMVESFRMTAIDSRVPLSMSTGQIENINGGLFANSVWMTPVVRNTASSGATGTFGMNGNDFFQLRMIEHPPSPLQRLS